MLVLCTGLEAPPCGSTYFLDGNLFAFRKFHVQNKSHLNQNYLTTVKRIMVDKVSC